MNIIEASGAESLVKEFYEETCKTTLGTRKSFEQIGVELTRCALNNVPQLKSGKIEGIYAGAVARGGFGVLRPPTIRLLDRRARELGKPLNTFALGLKRGHNPAKEAAKIYLDTLSYSKCDLSSSLVLVYEMGEATGSTVQGVAEALRKHNLNPRNFVFLVGAACIDQTESRLEKIAPGMTLVVGSRWRYVEEAGPTQYYLTKMRYEDKWIELHPRDWGDCVSGMDNDAGVKSFLDFMGEAVSVSNSDKAMLYDRWASRIGKN